MQQQQQQESYRQTCGCTVTWVAGCNSCTVLPPLRLCCAGSRLYCPGQANGCICQKNTTNANVTMNLLAVNWLHCVTSQLVPCTPATMGVQQNHDLS